MISTDMNLYILFEAGWGIFELLNVLVICIISILLVYIILKERESKVLFFAWALNLQKSKKDMDILLTALILFVVVFSIFFFGELLNNLPLIIISQILGLVSYLLISYVILRWAKIFLRFAHKEDYAVRD
ncbi:MAG: hypothetical protein RAK22_01545 [Nanoarchaeota archaeon]|nr:hypothetical protein [Nanoarchaeota archaeon]